jgi:uridine kinase
MIYLEEYFDRREPSNGRFFTIAIDGRGSSGKSTLLDYLARLYKGFTVLHGDDYWHHIEDEAVWGEFDEARFAREVVKPLQTGNTYHHSFYDFQTMKWQDFGQQEVHNVFCLERGFAFKLPLKWDIKIWIETPKKICAERSIKRDTHHLGKERATAAWRVWQGREDEYIKTTKPKDQADIVLSGTKPFVAQLR